MVKSKFIKRFNFNLLPEELVIIHILLKQGVKLESIPAELQPYFLALQKEISKEILSFKPICHEI